mmetsp:Transcript_9277/g.20752  ORF Transcript_9277/g.20752 Transcript_9277/m.20752 type:complete len:202 (+) Transcript_9277:34-639(+)
MRKWLQAQNLSHWETQRRIRQLENAESKRKATGLIPKQKMREGPLGPPVHHPHHSSRSGLPASCTSHASTKDLHHRPPGPQIQSSSFSPCQVRRASLSGSTSSNMQYGSPPTPHCHACGHKTGHLCPPPPCCTHCKRLPWASTRPWSFSTLEPPASLSAWLCAPPPPFSSPFLRVAHASLLDAAKHQSSASAQSHASESEI